MTTPFIDPTDSVSAVMTDNGRSIIAHSILGDLAFQLVGFKVGRDGYNSLNPVKVQYVNSSDTGLIDPIFPDVGNPPTSGTLAPFVDIETPFPNVLAAVCRLSHDECTYGLGEIGIWCRILSGSGIYTTDSLWLMALAHFPLLSKTDLHTFVFRVLIAQ